jgi:hypothetical protein
MNSPAPLLQPAECVLLLIDQQAGLAFGVGSSDRQVLLNNTVALARTAAVFDVPVVVALGGGYGIGLAYARSMLHPA